MENILKGTPASRAEMIVEAVVASARIRRAFGINATREVIVTDAMNYAFNAYGERLGRKEIISVLDDKLGDILGVTQ